jgi:hypothetical protein
MDGARRFESFVVLRLDLGLHVDDDVELERRMGGERADLDERRDHRREPGLVDRVVDDARDEAVLELGLDVVGEVLAHEVERHAPLAEAGKRRAPLDLPRRLVEPALDLVRRHLDLERLLPGSGVF